MRLVYSDRYAIPNEDPEGFPSSRFGRVARRLIEISGEAAEFVSPPMPSREDLEKVHSRAYIDRVLSCRAEPGEEERAGLRFTKPLVGAHRMHCGGTLAASRLALDEGVGLHCGGGAHHAHFDRADGFCLFNDIAYAAKALLDERAVRRVAVVDLDAHQGDGTAALLREVEGASTFSMHRESGFPEKREAGDLDVEVPEGIGDGGYLNLLRETLDPFLEERSPEMILYVAGADGLRGDPKGDLGLSPGGLLERDRLVFSKARSSGVAIAVVLAGGYGPDLSACVEVQARTLQEGLKNSRLHHVE